MNRILALLLPVAAGTLALQAAAYVPGRGTALRRAAAAPVRGLLTDGLLVFLLVWKLTPAVLHASYFFRDPPALLFAPGGAAGTAAGAAAAAALALFRFSGRGKNGFEQRLRLPAVILLAAWLAAAGTVSALYGGPGGAAGAAEAVSRQAAPEPFRAEGRITVVNFWASWCGPCRGELPELVSFWRRIEEGSLHPAVRFLTVNLASTEKSAGDADAFITENGLTFPVISDTEGTLSAYFDITSIPTTLILSPDGEELRRFEGAVGESQLRGAAEEAAEKTGADYGTGTTEH